MLRGIITQGMFDYVPELQFDIGYRYFLGNMDNYTRALLPILKSVKAKLPLLESMIITKEYEGLRIIAQTLNKMLGNVGAVNLSDRFYQLERMLLNEDYTSIKDELTACISSLIDFSEHLELLFKNTNLKNSNEAEEQISFLNFDFTKTKESIKLSSQMLERKII
jgi:HPt (histidine-containing phosphotransfer) domain-containing protein